MAHSVKKGGQRPSFFSIMASGKDSGDFPMSADAKYMDGEKAFYYNDTGC
jgi:hypothetical protein